MLDISLIGTGGMMPLHNRFLTSVAARLNGSMLLIDCGEGTQVTLKQLGWGFRNLDCLCFSHFHADHISGLPGLLLTVGNFGRTEPITIIGPVGVQRVVMCLRVIAPELPFELNFIELSGEKSPDTVTLGEYHISALSLNHTMDCLGYSLSLQRQGKFDADRARQQDIPLKLWSKLQNGETARRHGKVYTPSMVLGPMRKGLKISYITDTLPTAGIPEFICGSDLFICEGLYGDDEKRAKAKAHKHMIFSEAATLAKQGQVKELWLTHYSPALPDPDSYIETAKNIFKNTKAGHDRMTKTIIFDDCSRR